MKLLRRVTIRLVGLAGLLALAASAASVRLAWDAVPGAVEYVVWAGPATGDFDRVTMMITNTTYTVTNLTAGRAYRFGLSAFTPQGGSEIAEVTASPRAATLWFEWAPDPAGPWQAMSSNVVDAGPGFYRGRMEIR